MTENGKQSAARMAGMIGTVLGTCCLLALGVPLKASTAQGNNLYIAQNATGGANGADCADALPASWFNSASNWGGGSGQIGPGTAVHLCGIFTGASNSNILVFHGDGTAANPITVLWEPGAVLQEAYCPPQGYGGCVQVGGHSYITLDGGTNGIIQNTANGTSLASQQASTAIEDDGGTYLTIQNLTIQNIYVHSSSNDTIVGNSSTNCVYDNGTATGWQILHNTMHDMSWCIEIQYNATSNVAISGNNIYNVDHAIAFGGPSPGQTLSGVNIYKNNIHDYSNWDTAADSYHHDGIHIWGNGNNGSDRITNVNIFDNTFGGCIGQNVTAHIFIEANAGGTSNVAIYNNALIDTCKGADNDGLLTTGVDSGYRIYNNTFVGAPTDTCVGTSSSPNVFFTNNVVSGCGTLMYVTSAGGYSPGGLSNNVYANCPGTNCFTYHGNYSGSLGDWQSASGQDSGATYVANAGLTSSGAPGPGSPVIGKGLNLSILNLLSLNFDILGTPRPLLGSWTAGAFASASGANQLAPPTGLTATVR